MPVVVPDMTGSSNGLKLTAGAVNNMNEDANGRTNDTNPDVWDTEMQLVSSLAKLQKMEAMVCIILFLQLATCNLLKHGITHCDRSTNFGLYSPSVFWSL